MSAENLYLFFKEAINNAAKHSDASKVSVTLSLKEHNVEMIIQDNGRGFEVRNSFAGNGMGTLRKRVEELAGNFKIHSFKNEGTALELKFKIT